MPGTDLSLTVAAVDEVARGIRAYTFHAAGLDRPLPPFEAGAHLGLSLPSGLRREYSLCSDPAARDHYRIAVQREETGRGGSSELHDWLAPGTALAVRPPVNHFALPTGQGPVLLLAGGIGITPILSMLQVLRRQGRRFRLLYLVAAAERVAFAETLRPRGAEDIAIHIRAESGARLDLHPVLAGLGADWNVMCCGPAGMIDTAEAIAVRLGWPEGRLRRERFHAAPAAGTPGAEAGFTVTLARSGRQVEVAPGESILAALLSAGVDVDYSCEEGTCGTCITRFLTGEPDHRDSVLMPSERADRIALCCSRAGSGGLTLDL